MQVCVIGTGYVGLVTGTCLSYLGHDVVCVDNNPAKIDQLRAGQSPIYEPGLSELLTHCIKQGGAQKGSLRFSMSIEEGVRPADVVFIAVGTPPQPSGEPDLQYVETVARAIGAALDTGKPRVIVNKSTVPIGSGNWVEMLVREGIHSLQPAGQHGTGSLGFGQEAGPVFMVASNPEFLREGSAIGDTLYPDRIVVGAHEPEALSILRQLYAPILEQTFKAPSVAVRPEGFGAVPLVTTDLQSAEMIKYAANAFLATKISFANEIANLCEKVGADVVEVARGIGLDARIGQRFLNAGAGWGGSCFGKDVSALVSIAREYGYEPQMLKATIEVNQAQRQRIVQKLQDQLKIVKGKTIGLLGLAFKPNTDDLRDAPALDIAQTLLKMGARIKGYDPIAMEACKRQHPELELVYAADPTDLAWGCDAIVVVTEWDEFKRLDLAQLKAVMRSNVLVDARNIYDPATAEHDGFVYVGVGR
ncbi:UDP-glucose/GDP-mannose dehydrogenase family protein [bacterium]|nr:UDP-glucose/GDP-mannose dehydrogenase family protein [bacterium]